MDNSSVVEKRSAPRFSSSLQLCVDESNKVDVRNISLQGLCFCAANGSYPARLRATLTTASLQRVDCDLNVIWRRQFDGGSRFLYGASFSFSSLTVAQSRLSKILEDSIVKPAQAARSVVSADIPTFTLLVDGQDIDTSAYEFFPRAEKSITDYSRVRRIIQELKSGLVPPDTNGYILGRFCVGSAEIDRAAIEAAHKAFLTYRLFSLSRRKMIFKKMYQLLLERKQALIELLVGEGHPRKLGEWQFEGMRTGSSPQTIAYYCKQIQTEIGRFAHENVYLVRRPDGVVCVNPPGNASASSSYNGILALLTGNTVVVRPSLHGPLSTIFLWKEVVHRALMDNGAPSGTVNITINSGNATLNEWISNPHVNDIIHFGSSDKGLRIGQDIFRAGKKPILELAGNDFMACWKDADINLATDALLDGFLGSTQVCMVPKIALVHQDVIGQFSKTFVEKVNKLKIALPTDPDTILSPVMKIRQFYEFLKDAQDNGARLLCGSQRVDHRGKEDIDGLFVKPAVVLVDELEKALRMRFINEEIFFPLIPVIAVSGSDDDCMSAMCSLINGHKYGMRVSLWISSPKYTRRFIKNIENCGILRINSRHVAFSDLLSTHGGTRNSGGPFGEMNYFWQKTSHLQGISRMRTDRNVSRSRS